MNSVTSYTRWMNRLLIQRVKFIFQVLFNNNDDICCIMINQLIVKLKFNSKSQFGYCTIG